MNRFAIAFFWLGYLCGLATIAGYDLAFPMLVAFFAALLCCFAPRSAA